MCHLSKTALDTVSNYSYPTPH